MNTETPEESWDARYQMRTQSKELLAAREGGVEKLVTKVARALWEELNVPKGRNWDDHAVSAARIYWSDRARVAIAALSATPPVERGEEETAWRFRETGEETVPPLMRKPTPVTSAEAQDAEMVERAAGAAYRAAFPKSITTWKQYVEAGGGMTFDFHTIGRAVLSAIRPLIEEKARKEERESIARFVQSELDKRGINHPEIWTAIRQRSPREGE